MNSKIAACYLITVSILWGLTFPLIELSMKTQDPFLFVSLRFSLAAVPLLPYFIRNFSRNFFAIGALLGVMNCAIFIFQTMGLQTVSASRGGFLTGIYVLMVPFLAPLFKMGKPKLVDVVSALICFFGIYVLTGCNIGGFSIGDLWIIVCDIFIAISLICIWRYSKANLNPFLLAYSQIIFTALFSWVPTLLFSDCHFGPMFSLEVGSCLVVCSFFCTVLTFFWQCKYQAYVSIQTTALIFSLEPVFAACFDGIIKQKLPGLSTILGGVIILISILYLELSKTRRQTI